MNTFSIFAVLAVGIAASASPRHNEYTFNITNGGAMPISPGVIYSVSDQNSLTQVGDEPTPGLVQLCQTGNAAGLIEELKANPKVKSIVQTSGPVFPGQSVAADIELKGAESVHFLAMYGKTKELCSSIAIRNVAEARGTDQVISSGNFTEPIVPADTESICSDAKNGVSCLRSLSSERTDKKQIHFFGGYLPSVLQYLERRYGAQDALSLVVPTSGAVSYRLERKNH